MSKKKPEKEKIEAAATNFVSEKKVETFELPKQPKRKVLRRVQTVIEETTISNPQDLTVGVNFLDENKNEVRLEAGLIEAGTLPPSFEKMLRERNLLFDV